MDPTLVTGLLTIAGTTASGALALAGFVVREHVATLKLMGANDTKNSDSIHIIADEMRLTREAQQRQEARITSLEETIEDKRSAEALAQSKTTTEAMQRAVAAITGQFEAVPAQDPPAEIVAVRRVPRTVK